MLKRKFVLIGSALILLAGSLFAMVSIGRMLLGAAPQAQQPAEKDPFVEAEKIRAVLKKLFEKPDTPLVVIPVSIEGGFAVAGWLQGEMGGRALLRHENDRWQIVLCGGDDLVQSQALVGAGLDEIAAKRLTEKIQLAELQLPQMQRIQLATFKGIVQIDSNRDDHHHP